jgi:hypothetical protein
MFLAEIDDEPLFARGDRLFEIARQIEETRLEPIRMLEQILAREVVEAVDGIIGGGMSWAFAPSMPVGAPASRPSVKTIAETAEKRNMRDLRWGFKPRPE